MSPGLVGKSRSHVANTLRLQTLPDPVKDHIHAGRLSAGHARALVGHHDAERLAEEIVARGLNVRQVEAMARETNRRQEREGQRPQSRSLERRKTPNLVALEKRISDALGLAVSIDRSRPRRRAEHPLSQPRSARRSAAPAGKKALSAIQSLFSFLCLPRRLESLALRRVIEARIIVSAAALTARCAGWRTPARPARARARLAG